MASDFDRDNSIDALLKGARRDPAALEAGPACLDAESLAAWADGGLDADRVRAVEAHVADCARCQALSAALFATDDTVAAGVSVTPNAPKVVPFRRNRVMYWMPIAAGTIAATLVIWLGVRDQNELESQAETVITASRAAQTPAPAVSESRLQDRQGQQGLLAGSAPKGTAAAPADAKRLQRKDAPAPAELRAERAKEEAATANRSRALAAEPAASPAPARIAVPPPPPPAMMPPPPAPVAPPPPPATTVTAASPVVATSATVGASQGQVGAAVGGVRQMSALEKVEPRVVAEFSSVPLPSTIGGLPPSSPSGGRRRRR